MFLTDLIGRHFYAVPPLLGLSVFSCLALLSLLKGKRSDARFLFAGFCISGALINTDIALVSLIRDRETALAVDRLIYLFFVFSLPIYVRFVHVFLGMSRRWLDRAAYGLSLFFLVFTPTEFFISGFHEYAFGRIAKPGPVYHAFCVAGGATVLYCLWTLYGALKKAEKGRQKNRIKYILFGMGTSTLLLLLNYLPICGLDIYPLGNFGFIPAIVLAFGVLKYDLLDLDAVIRKGLIYVILTGSLTFCYVLILYGMNVLFVNAPGGNPWCAAFLTALFMVLLFDPVKTRVQRFVDRHFFRGKYDYQKTLREISGRMTSLLRLDEIRRFVLSAVSEALQVRRAGLMLMDSSGLFHFFTAADDQALWRGRARALRDFIGRNAGPAVIPWEVLRRLLGEENEGLSDFFKGSHSVIVIPLISREALKGVVVLGEKTSGELFVHDDRELLSTIANQCAIAVENAGAYEEIERLNRDLEEKVRQRTADLERILEEKERTQNQLIRSESLAAIGGLVAGAAHEINNPVAGASSLIQSSIEALAEEWAVPDEKGETAMENILDDLRFSLKELGRVRDIVKSLLGLSRQTQTYTEPVNMNDVVGDALRVLHKDCKNQDLTIKRDFQSNLPDIKGNFANLGQVFLNIIKNALQSLPGGRGTIRITTRYHEKTGRVVFECQDTGQGIPPEHLKDIFKPFFTTKEAGKGTGLGLYLSHEIIKKHGGCIEVASEAARGSIFRVELPLGESHE